MQLPVCKAFHRDDHVVSVQDIPFGISSVGGEERGRFDRLFPQRGGECALRLYEFLRDAVFVPHAYDDRRPVVQIRLDDEAHAIGCGIGFFVMIAL